MTTPVSSPRRPGKLSRRLSRLLNLGMLISLLFIVLGMLLLGVRGGEMSNRVIPLGQLPGRLFSFQPEAFLGLGILILLAVPIALVISLVLLFWIEREKLYAVLSVVVLSVLLLSILLAQRLFLS